MTSERERVGAAPKRPRRAPPTSRIGALHVRRDAPLSPALLRTLQRTAGNTAVSAMLPPAAGTTLMRSPTSDVLPARSIKKFGIVYKREGVRVREGPSTATRELARLPFNTRIFVDGEREGFYFVTTDSGQVGYVAASHVKTNLPEPEAKIHWISPGETALEISRRYYGGSAKWGSDHRFYVNGLVFVNAGPGDRGIYKPDAEADWDTTQLRSGYMIWVPSLAFMKSLRGTVSSGSITYEAWESVKAAAETVANVVAGLAAFIAGLLHGALESLWDILVGLKDLAVMVWDILKSLFTGNLLTDAKGLWDDLSGLDWGALLAGWIDDFSKKWNADSLLSRWHFRGWVIGYAIMEVLMLFFSGGIITGIKWVGKSAKVAKVISALPRVAKFAEAAKASQSGQRLARLLGRGAVIAENTSDAAKWIERLLTQPKQIWGKSPDQIADVFRKAGHTVTVEQSTKGSKLSVQLRIRGHRDIQNIQVHPGGGRHGGSYYKISSSTQGKIKVVDRVTYVPTVGEKATIIFMDGPDGWLVRAVAANAAAQKAGEQVPIGIDESE